MTKLILTSVALATVLAAAGSAYAGPPTIKVLQGNVSYRATDLETPQGARALLTRVNSLALRMCRSGPASPLAHPVASEIDACRQQAVSRAVADLNAPLVTAAYADRQNAELAQR